jgi:hypothetical protein
MLNPRSLSQLVSNEVRSGRYSRPRHSTNVVPSFLETIGILHELSNICQANWRHMTWWAISHRLYWEAVASADGTSAAGATAGGTVPRRARETAAWALSLASDRATARAAATAASTAASGASGSSTVESLPGAFGVLVEAVLGGDKMGGSGASGADGGAGAVGSPKLAAAAATAAATANAVASARSLRILAKLDRLPAGEWPGSLRRLTRAAAAAGLPPAVARDLTAVCGRGLHSSTYQLNRSRLCL